MIKKKKVKTQCKKKKNQKKNTWTLIFSYVELKTYYEQILAGYIFVVLLDDSWT